MVTLGFALKCRIELWMALTVGTSQLPTLTLNPGRCQPRIAGNDQGPKFVERNSSLAWRQRNTVCSVNSRAHHGPSSQTSETFPVHVSDGMFLHGDDLNGTSHV